MSILDVRRHYTRYYKRIINWLSTLDDEFEFNFDNGFILDISATGKKDDRYIYIVERGNQFTVSYRSSKCQSNYKVLSSQREVVIFLSELIKIL